MENSISIHTIIIPEVETSVPKYKAELVSQVAIQAKQDARRPKLLTLTEYTVLGVNPIVTRGQEEINFVKQKSQLWSQVANLKEREQQAMQESSQSQFHQDELERQKGPLEKRKAEIAATLAPRRRRVWFIIAAVACGIADGILAYSAFRFMYRSFQAIIISLAIAVAISCSHLITNPWLHRAKTRLEKWLKIGAVLTLAALFFFWISSMRVASMNAVISIDPQQTQLRQSAPVSALAIAGISFVLFVFVFALSLRFWVSADEKKRLEEYQKAADQLTAITTEIETSQAKREQLANEIITKKADIRSLALYVKRTIERIIAIAKAARDEYEKVYAQFRDEVPDFFGQANPLNFDHDLGLFNDFQNEQLP